MKKYIYTFLILLVFSTSTYFYLDNNNKESVSNLCMGDACINIEKYDQNTRFHILSSKNSNNCERILKASRSYLDDPDLFNFLNNYYNTCVFKRDNLHDFVQKDLLPVHKIPFNEKEYLFGKMDIEGMVFAIPKEYA